MQTKLETITPIIAQRLLGDNNKNRNLKKGLVEQIATDITSGDFRITHQGIAIDDKGILIDGQHRLAAIIKAGVGVQMFVSRNVPAETMNVIDIGAKRTQADALGISGYENTVILAAATQIYASLLGSNPISLEGGRRGLNNYKILSFIEAHSEIIDAVHWVAKNKRAKQLGFASVVAAFYAFYGKSNRNKAREFFTVLADNHSAEPNHPAVVLYEHILRRRAGDISVSRRYLIAAFIRSWKNFMDNNYGNNIVIKDPIAVIREFTERQNKKG